MFKQIEQLIALLKSGNVEKVMESIPIIEQSVPDVEAAISSMSLDELANIPAPIKKVGIDVGSLLKIWITNPDTTAKIDSIIAKLNGTAQV